MILPDMPNLAEIAYYMHQVNEELEIQSRIVKARALDEGYFDGDLATQTQKFLIGGTADEIEGINLMSIALRTILRRLDVSGFTANDETFQEWVNHVWAANKMEIGQSDAHRGAERDGEFFVIVDYDRKRPRPWEPEKQGVPVFYLHERYTSAQASYGDDVGSNQGCKAHYRNDDPNQPLDMVSKRWIETVWENGEPVTTQRMTLFIAEQPNTPARIEKYQMNDAGEWEQRRDTAVDEAGNQVQEEWPIWWTTDGTETGASLPIPVIHFRNEEMAPVTRRLWGMQSGMDHAWSSLISGITVAAHQIFVAFGFWPTTDGKPPADDGSNLIEVSPRMFIGNGERTPGEASLDTIDPADLGPIVDAMDKIAIYTSFVAGLPINNFVISKSVASSSTLRQGEAGLEAHVNALMRLFGRSWSQVFEIARILEKTYGSDEYKPDTAVPLWKPAETTNVEAVNAEAVAQYNTGIPWEVVAQHVWGYSQDEIKKMQELRAQMEQNTPESGTNQPDSAVTQNVGTGQ